MSHWKNKYLYFIIVVLIYSCNNKPSDNYKQTDEAPDIFPDYTGVTIPPDIAPLNFKINNSGEGFFVRVSGKDKSIEIASDKGKTEFPLKEWHKLLADNTGGTLKFDVFVKRDDTWFKLRSFENTISNDSIDQYLFYRLLYPGYELWKEMGIYGRDVTSFKERPLIENKSVYRNCMNCHSFNQNSPDTYMFHIRGDRGGTIIYKNGKVKKVNVKTKNMMSAGVYPSWHPNGRFIAFSTNKIKQLFHAQGRKFIDVFDQASDMIVYDTETEKVFSDSVLMSKQYMETFPCWSPDGKYLYFTRAVQRTDTTFYKNIHYDLCRIPFDEKQRSFGKVEVIYPASEYGKSVTLPRVSPDNRFVMFTLSYYGTFSIWHPEADLYLLDLKTMKAKRLNVNSDDVDSFHSWSSDGRWFVFSSKRLDTQTARPFFAHIDTSGNTTKPFVLPQKDPDFYNSFLKTYNRPELVKGPFNFDTWQLVRQAAFRGKNVEPGPGKGHY